MMIVFWIIFLLINPCYADLTANLQGYWKLDDASGNAVDQQGNNDLTAAGSPTYQQSTTVPDSNYSMQLPATTDYFYSGVNPTGLVITGNLSLMVWVKSPSHATEGCAAGRWNVPGEQCYFIDVRLDAGPYIYCGISSTGSNANWDAFGGAANIANGSWHQIIMIYDGSQIYLYYDNSLIGSTVYSSGIYGSTNCKFTIGTNQSGNYLFKGYVDEVAVWDRALSPSEVSDLYNYGFSVPSATINIIYPLIKDASSIGRTLIDGGMIN